MCVLIIHILPEVQPGRILLVRGLQARGREVQAQEPAVLLHLQKVPPFTIFPFRSSHYYVLFYSYICLCDQVQWLTISFRLSLDKDPALAMALKNSLHSEVIPSLSIRCHRRSSLKL